MAEPTWGQLRKAQDDDKLIDTAIAEAIAAHETDPDSHTGPDESLETHKAQEIIDHPAGSVLADKSSATEGIFESTFDSIDAWTKFGEVNLSNWGCINVFIDDDSGHSAYLYSLAPITVNFLDFTKDMLWQTIFGFWIASPTSFNIGVNRTEALTPTRGFGFYHDGTSLKAYFHDGTTCHYSGAISGFADAVHAFRVQHIAATKKLNYYIDGALVSTFTYTEIPTTGTGYIKFIFYDAGGGEAEYGIHKVTISRQI